MDKDEMKKSAEFLVKNLTGMEVEGTNSVSVRYKTLVNFAKIFGITDPKYVGSEEDGVIACHAFANHYVIKSLYKMLAGAKIEKDGQMVDPIKKFGKVLHAGQVYDFEGCVDIKPGDKLKVSAKFGKVWLVEDTMILYTELIMPVKNQNNELVCKATINAAIRPGGY